jgi:hypothetical protein
MIYPNPVIDKANLTITADKPQQLQVKIMDNTGRIIKRMQQNISAGSSLLPVDVSSLAGGIYYMEITSETINERKRFIKQ